MDKLGSISIYNLYIFKLLIETGSVTQTAKYLNKSQSTISGVLKLLNTKLGNNLLTLDKNNRYIPTPYGKEVYHAINEFLDIIDDQSKKSTETSYKILATDFFAISFLPSFLTYCKKNDLKVTVDIGYQYTDPLYYDNINQYDLCLGMVENITGFNNIPLPVDEGLIIAPLHYPKDSLSLDEYLSANHIAVTRSETFAILRTFGKATNRKKIIISKNMLTSLSILEKSDDLLMFISSYIYQIYKDKFKVKQIEVNFSLPNIPLLASWPKKYHSKHISEHFLTWLEQAKKVLNKS